MGFQTAFSEFLYIVTYPFKKVTLVISNGVSGVLDNFVSIKELREENEQLSEEIKRLNEKLVDHERMKHQNQLYKSFLGIKQDNPDYEVAEAWVISRDPDNRFGSFTIDKGSLAGISPRDPVITSDGLVGVVWEVGLTSSKVRTILDVSVDVSAYSISSRDTGVITGDIELSFDGRCKMSYLARNSEIQEGELVVTSGVGGLFPNEIIIGTVEDILPEAHGISQYAIIKPAADPLSVKDVFVITGFYGKADYNAEE